jgi:hypothetical protein
MKNKMVTDEQRDYYKRSTGHVYLEERRSGRTIGLALKCIGDAMCSPGIGVVIRDHEDAVISNQYLVKKIKSIITELDLDYFRVDIEKTVFSLVYDVFEK